MCVQCWLKAAANRLESQVLFGLYLILVTALLDAQHHLEQGDENAKEGAHSHYQKNAAQVAYLQGHSTCIFGRILYVAHTPTNAPELSEIGGLVLEGYLPNRLHRRVSPSTTWFSS